MANKPAKETEATEAAAPEEKPAKVNRTFHNTTSAKVELFNGKNLLVINAGDQVSVPKEFQAAALQHPFLIQ